MKHHKYGAEVMKERNTQNGDAETAICHVCNERFSTQEELLRHLEQVHPDDVLPDPNPD